MAKGRKSGGRRKGTPNKTTKAVKEALEIAFDGLGGTTALVRWARENPTEYYKLWAKMLPQEIKADLRVTEGLAERLARAKARVLRESTSPAQSASGGSAQA